MSSKESPNVYLPGLSKVGGEKSMKIPCSKTTLLSSTMGQWQYEDAPFRRPNLASTNVSSFAVIWPRNMLNDLNKWNFAIIQPIYFNFWDIFGNNIHKMSLFVDFFPFVIQFTIIWTNLYIWFFIFVTSALLFNISPPLFHSYFFLNFHLSSICLHLLQK